MIAAVFFVLTATNYGTQSREVQVCEVNHVCNREGEPKFTQVILWRWVRILPNPSHHVAQYMVTEPDDIRVRARNGKTEVTWRSRQARVYTARARTYLETMTFHDREVEDRKKLPPRKRVPYFR